MSTMSHYRPSKRPKVGDVKSWDCIFADSITSHWKGDAHNGTVQVYNGYPFPDFYKVVFEPSHGGTGKKINKLFYGESAWNQTEMFVYDMGFRNVLGRI